ncbi:MAG: hypothetical protein GY720_07140 [bacterium]|nr:hypothetical protein [bacterium]
MEYFANIFGSLGTVNWVGQGGSFVDHRTTPSYHRTGEAIDLKFIKWPNAKNTKACNGPYDTSPSKPKRHRRYLAVEASLRKYFGYVLNTYIPDHDNHFHVDNGCPAGLAINWGSSLRQYKSVAYFIQDCCIMFNNASITLDGIWGSQTDNAFDDLLDVLNLDCTDPKNSLSDYRLFLDYVQMHGFKNKLAGYYTYSCGGPL